VAWVRACAMQTCCILRITTLDLPLTFSSAKKMATEKVLLDSGATENFINPRMVRMLWLDLGWVPTRVQW
jgi:hypothetical protein